MTGEKNATDYQQHTVKHELKSVGCKEGKKKLIELQIIPQSKHILSLNKQMT